MFERITLSDVIRATALQFELSEPDLLGQCRKICFARPRQIAMYLCRELTDASYPAIGHLVGDRDHTTVMFAWRRVNELLAAGDTGAMEGVAAVRGRLNAGNVRRDYRARRRPALDLVAVKAEVAELAQRRSERLARTQRVRAMVEAGFYPTNPNGTIRLKDLPGAAI